MLRRLRPGRGLALTSAALLLASALLAAAHSHASERAGSLVGSFSRVPIGVVANPDQPSPSQHWHAGTTFDQEPCAVCMLSHQPGSAGSWMWSCPAVVAVRDAAAAPAAHAEPFACPPSARAPPLAC